MLLPTFKDNKIKYIAAMVAVAAIWYYWQDIIFLLRSKSDKINETDTPERKLSVGSRGEQVRSLQKLLNDSGIYPKISIDGIFGQATENALISVINKNSISLSELEDLILANKDKPKYKFIDDINSGSGPIINL